MNRQKFLRDAVTKCELNSKEQKELLKQYIILLAYNSKCLFESPVLAEYKRWEGLQAFRRLLRLQGDFSTLGISSPSGAIRLHAPLYEKFDNPYEAEVLAMEASASIPVTDIFPNVNIYTTEKNQILDITHSIQDEDKDYPLQSKIEELAKLCNDYPESILKEQEKKETWYDSKDTRLKKRNEKWDLMKEIMSVLVRSADRKDWRATMGVYGHLDPLEMMIKGWTETEKICDEIISATSTRDYSEEYIEAMERELRAKAERLEFLKRAIHQQMISDHDGQNISHIENLTKEYEDISNYIAKQWQSIKFGIDENGKKKEDENLDINDKETSSLDYTRSGDIDDSIEGKEVLPEEETNFYTISCNPMLKNQDPVRWYMYPHYCTDLQHVQVDKYLPRRELLNLLQEAMDNITADDIKNCKEANENNFGIEDFESLKSTFTTPPDVYIESLLRKLVNEETEAEGVNKQNFGLLSQSNFGYGQDITQDGSINGLSSIDVFYPMDKGEQRQSFARAEIKKERDYFSSLRGQLLQLLDQKTKIQNGKENKHQFHLGMGALAVMKDDPFMGEVNIPPEKAKSIYQKYKEWTLSLFDTSSLSSGTKNSSKFDPELDEIQSKIYNNKALLEKRILEEYMLNIYTDFCTHDSDMVNRKVLCAVEKDLISYIVPDFLFSDEASNDNKKKSKERKKSKQKVSTLEGDTNLLHSSPSDRIPYQFKNVYNGLIDAIESYLYKYDENTTAAIDSPEIQNNLTILNDLETAIDKVIYTVYGQKHQLNKKSLRLHIKSELMNSIEAHLEAIKVRPRKEQIGLSYTQSKRAMQSSFYRVMQELNQMGFTNVKEQNYLLNKMRHIMNSWTDEYLHGLVMPSTSNQMTDNFTREMTGAERQRQRSEKDVVTSIKVVLDSIFSKENIHTATLFSSADASLQNMYKSIEEIDDELRYNSIYTGTEDENKYQLHNLTDPTRRKIIRAKYFLDILRSKEDLYEKYIEKPNDYIVDELEDEMREFFEELYEDHPELGNSNFNNFDRVDFHTPESYETPDLRYKIYSDKEKTLPVEGYDASLDDRERKFSYKGAPENARKEFGLLSQIETRQRILPDDSMSLHVASDEAMSVHNDKATSQFKGKERYGFALKDLSADQPDQIDASKQGVTLIRDTKSKLVRIASLDEEKKRSWKKQMRRTQVHKLGENKD